MVSLRSLALALFSANGALAAIDGYCPILGPVLPPPKTPNNHTAVVKAAAELKIFLEKQFSSFNGTAISVGVKSIHEAQPLFEWHHTPRTLDPRGLRQVNSDSIYRLGSVSKVIAVLAILKLEGVTFEDRVTKYLPQLRELNNQPEAKDTLTQVEWDEITIGALASHMSGIGADMPIDLTNTPRSYQQFGLPHLGNSSLPGCLTCSPRRFFEIFGNRFPVTAPFTGPHYNNIAPSLMSLVVENVTGKGYVEFVQESILTPLGLKGTSGRKPEDSVGVISMNDTWWGIDLGFSVPTGGYYSTVTDLLTLGDAILSHKILSGPKTRKWLKPLTSTASVGTQIGAPWEIFRSTNLTRDQRLIEVYTKGGDLISYRTTFALIPDYDLVLTALVTGPELTGSTVPTIQVAAVKALLPALEQAGREQARASYAGTYSDPSTNSTMVISLEDTDPAPGLKVSKLIVRGVDVMASWPLLASSGQVPRDRQLPPTRLRLYPTELKTAKRHSWRGQFDATTPEQARANDALFPWADATCVSWASADRLAYGLKAVDQFIFNTCSSGRTDTAKSVELPAFKVTLTRG